jgi:Asp-tRNA(Asn)/Glu-tRNA(Gln) amidotransferase A subunit family amidase
MVSSSPDQFDLIEPTIADIHEAITSGGATIEEIVAGYLDRIEEYDTELQAIIRVNENARERARRLDKIFRERGFVGGLHGIPVVLKDNQDTSDMPTTAGSKALEKSRPSTDAFIVQQIRNAGGIIIAKANLHEFALGVDTVSSLGGETRNPYDTTRRPSGSSGGTAAAIAANFGTIGTGSDTCSSVRSPPAFNNLVGIRPTRGLVSRSGIIPLSETQDTPGPITRTVADAARLLEVLVGYDPADPVTARGTTHIPEEGYTAHLETNGLESARIGVARQFFGLQGETSASAATARKVTTVVENAIEEFATAGATIVDPVDVVDKDQLRSARVIEYEFARDFNCYVTEMGDKTPHDTLSEVVSSTGIGHSIKTRIENSIILDVNSNNLQENGGYLRRLRRQRELQNHVLAQMVKNDLDALLYPPSTIPPVEIPENQPFEEMNCELAAHTGFPAMVVPAGFTADGLPVGVELFGRPFSEPRLLQMAYAFEQSTNYREPPAQFGRLE